MIEVKTATVNTINTIVNLVFALLFALIIFRFTTTEDIGTYYYWLSIIIFGGFIFNAPFNVFYYIFPTLEKEKVGKYFLTLCIFILPIAIVSYIGLFKLIGFRGAFLYGVFAAIVTTLQGSILALFAAFYLRYSVISNFLSAFTKVGIVLLIAYHGTLNFHYMAIALTISALFQVIFFATLIKSIPTIAEMREVLLIIKGKFMYGLFYHIVSLLSSIMLYYDNLIIGLLYTVKEIGIYNSIGNVMKYVLYTIPNSLSFFILPLTVKFKKSNFMSFSLVLLTFMLAPLCTTIIYPVPFIQIITGGGEYLNYAHIALYFLPAVLVLPIQAAYVQYFLGNHKQKLMEYLAATMAVNVVLSYVLSQILGLWLGGIALALSISAIFYTALILRDARELLGWKKPLFSILQTLMLATFMYYLVAQLPKSFIGEIEAAIYATIAMAIAYIVNIGLSLLFSYRDIRSIFDKLILIFKEKLPV